MYYCVEVNECDSEVRDECVCERPVGLFVSYCITLLVHTK